MKRFVIILMLVTLLWVSLASAQGGYHLSWWTIDSGGGQSSGGGYTLLGTGGQTDAGAALTGGDYILVGGFWGAGGLAASPEASPIYLPTVLKHG